MIKAVAKESPAICFFLGDGLRDIAALSDKYPDLPVYSVRGNCDFRSDVSNAIICNVGGVSIFATHGHLYSVKYETEFSTLAEHAKDAGADIALFGHTHWQHLSEKNGVMLLNPGSAGRGSCCYAVIEINGGQYSAYLKHIS